MMGPKVAVQFSNMCCTRCVLILWLNMSPAAPDGNNPKLFQLLQGQLDLGLRGEKANTHTHQCDGHRKNKFSVGFVHHSDQQTLDPLRSLTAGRLFHPVPITFASMQCSGGFNGVQLTSPPGSSQNWAECHPHPIGDNDHFAPSRFQLSTCLNSMNAT